MRVNVTLDDDAEVGVAYEMGAEEGVPSGFAINIVQDGSRTGWIGLLTKEQVEALKESCEQALQNAENLGG